MYSLSQTAGEFLPVSLDEAKAHLKVDFANDDDLITRLINAATDQAEQWTGRAITRRTYTLKLRDFPGGRRPQFLPRPPLVEVESIDYFDSDGDAAELDPEALLVETGEEPTISPARGGSWPSADSERRQPVSIAYEAGYADAAAVPDLIKSAILLQVGMLYEYREQVITGTIVAELIGGFKDLLAPYVVGDEFQKYSEDG